WQKSRLEALKKLPAHLRKVARPLVGVNDDGQDLDYAKHQKLRTETIPVAAEMSKEQRVALFETLFPGLGQAVEDGWQLLNELPHSMSGLEAESKCFRIPGNDGLLLKPRLAWVESLLGRLGEYPNKDLAWHAAWAGHHWDSESTSILLAAAIDGGG